MARATEDILADLHGEMAAAMRKKLQDGDYTASELSVIRQFLKDNFITVDPASNDDLAGLADDLPTEIEGDVIPLYGAGE